MPVWKHTIQRVLQITRFSQIFQTIVMADAIFMINFMFRPCAVEKSPCDTMPFQMPSFEGQSNIPIREKSGNISFAVIFRVFDVCNTSRFWIVRENFSQIVNFHDAIQSSMRARPGNVRFGLVGRFFIFSFGSFRSIAIYPNASAACDAQSCSGSLLKCFVSSSTA